MLSSGPSKCKCQSHLCLNVEKFHQLHQLKLVLLNDFCEIQIGNHKGYYGHLKIRSLTAINFSSNLSKTFSRDMGL